MVVYILNTKSRGCEAKGIWCFDLPKRTIRKNSIIKFLFEQTRKVVEKIYKKIAGFDMSYGEIKDLYRREWEKDFQ